MTMPSRPAVPAAHPVVTLVVDDDRTIRELLSLMLRIEGHCLLVAENAEEALALSRAHLGEIDLVITDFAMPGIDGATLVAILQKERPKTRLILMSSMESVETQAVRLGVPFLPKPFEYSRFKGLVRRMLAGDDAGQPDSP